MKQAIIIYGSRYGTTKLFASQLSQMTGIPCISYREVKNIQDYNQIIYLGALYAGTVLGLKSVGKKISTNQKLIIATVGLVDPADPDNIKYIRDNVKTVIPEKLYDKSMIFHLWGAIDYSTMNFKHRIMMSLMHSKLSKKPIEKLNIEEKTILDTYGKKVDYADLQALETMANTIMANK